MTTLKQRLLAKRRHPVDLTIDGDVYTVWVRPVVFEDLLPFTSSLPTVFTAIAGLGVSSRGAEEASLEDQLGALEFMRLLVCAGVVSWQLGVNGTPEDLALSMKPGKDSMTMEDLEDGQTPGDSPDAYPNAKKVFDKIVEVSDLVRTFQRFAGGEAVPAEPGAVGGDVTQPGESLLDGPVDDSHDLDAGPAGLQPGGAGEGSPGGEA